MTIYTDDFSTDTSSAWTQTYWAVTWNSGAGTMTFSPTYYGHTFKTGANTPSTNNVYSKVIFSGFQEETQFSGGPSVRYHNDGGYSYYLALDYKHSTGYVRFEEHHHDTSYWPAASGSTGVSIGQLNLTTDALELRWNEDTAKATAYLNGTPITGLVDITLSQSPPAGVGTFGINEGLAGFDITLTYWEGGDVAASGTILSNWRAMQGGDDAKFVQVPTISGIWVPREYGSPVTLPTVMGRRIFILP